MTFSYKKNLIFIIALGLLAASFTGCMKEDHWQGWKVINDQWYENHKNDVGYELLPSGVSYKKIREGNPSDGRPNVGSSIVATYTGTLFNDSVFDKGTKASLGTLGYTVAGFQEILLKMHPGDIYRFRIPYDLGYGSAGSGVKVPPYSALQFEVELNAFYN